MTEKVRLKTQEQIKKLHGVSHIGNVNKPWVNEGMLDEFGKEVEVTWADTRFKSVKDIQAYMNFDVMSMYRPALVLTHTNMYVYNPMWFETLDHVSDDLLAVLI